MENNHRQTSGVTVITGTRPDLSMATTLQLPREIPIIVLSQTVLFPNCLLPLHIFEERYRQMLKSALDTSRIFGVASNLSVLDPDLPVPDLSEIMGIGVVRACVERPDGTSDLILQGLARVRILGEAQTEPFRTVQVEVMSTAVANSENALVLADKIKEQAQVLVENGVQMPQQMEQYLASIEDPEIIGDLMAASFVGDSSLRQQLLAEELLEKRLELVLAEMESISLL